MVFRHFGRTEQFKLYGTADGKIISEQVVGTNGAGHGALAGFLKNTQADICPTVLKQQPKYSAYHTDWHSIDNDNFRREDRCAIAEELKTVCKNVKHPRDGKTVYIGST